MSELSFKDPVRLATTANISLSGEQTIDGATSSDDRVLVKNQTDTTQNGIYVSSSGAWERARDFDGAGDFTTGTAVLVTAGSTNGGKQFYCTVSDDPPDLSTSTITWTQFTPGASLGGDLTAIEALAGTGIARRTGTDTWTVGTLVTNAELANMADSTLKGIAVGSGTSVPVDLTATQATAILNAFTTTLKGLVPAPVTATGKFLKDNGTWATGGGDLLIANALSEFVSAGTGDDAFDNIKQAATDTYTGAVELATTSEATTGTDTTRAVTAAGVAAVMAARTESFIIAVTDENAVVTAGTNKASFRMPYAITLAPGSGGLRGSLVTAQSSSGGGTLVTVNVRANGTTILSTNLTFSNTAATSVGATAPVISDTGLADDDLITVDVVSVGDGTAKGLKITLIGTRA